jgi:Fe-S-cluster formation regulator IscX/YfhJ
MKNDMKIAVLIDADNVSDKYVKYIFDEISNLGMPTFKRIYGDWTKPQLGSWKTVLLNYSITPIQQYSYTTGKNATDAALIIDAMDILYSNNVDGFCIVSSDSDFTRLATRLREAGMYVVGMGEKKTPTPFISACEKFKYLEVLASDPEAAAEQSESVQNGKQGNQKEGMASKKELIQSLKTIITESSDEDGWANLGEVGSRLNNRYPDFDTRNYGHSKLRPLILSLNQFEIEARRTSKNQNSHYVVRNKAKQR